MLRSAVLRERAPMPTYRSNKKKLTPNTISASTCDNNRFLRASRNATDVRSTFRTLFVFYIIFPFPRTCASYTRGECHQRVQEREQPRVPAQRARSVASRGLLWRSTLENCGLRTLSSRGFPLAFLRNVLRARITPTPGTGCSSFRHTSRCQHIFFF